MNNRSNEKLKRRRTEEINWRKRRRNELKNGK
jgi:hypothetical protein